MKVLDIRNPEGATATVELTEFDVQLLVGVLGATTGPIGMQTYRMLEDLRDRMELDERFTLSAMPDIVERVDYDRGLTFR